MTAPARRPQVVLFDLFETCLQLEGLRPRFEALGRPGPRAGAVLRPPAAPGHGDDARGRGPAVRRPSPPTCCGAPAGATSPTTRSPRCSTGSASCPCTPDVAPALRRLAEAGVPAYGFTHGSAEVAGAALEAGGVRDLFTDVMSCAELKLVQAAAARCTTGRATGSRPRPPAPPWSPSTRGTCTARSRPGLLGGFCERLEGRIPDAVARPHVAAPDARGRRRGPPRPPRRADPLTPRERNSRLWPRRSITERLTRR